MSKSDPFLQVPEASVSRPSQALLKLYQIGYLRGFAKGMVTGMTTNMDVASRVGTYSLRDDEESPKIYLGIASSTRSTDDLIREKLRETLGDLPGVECVCIKKEASVYHVWTVVTAKDDGVDDAVYSLELQIMDHFDLIPFDFVVIHRGHRELDDLVPGGSLIIFKK